MPRDEIPIGETPIFAQLAQELKYRYLWRDLPVTEPRPTLVKRTENVSFSFAPTLISLWSVGQEVDNEE